MSQQHQQHQQQMPPPQHLQQQMPPQQIHTTQSTPINQLQQNVQLSPQTIPITPTNLQETTTDQTVVSQILEEIQREEQPTPQQMYIRQPPVTNLQQPVMQQMVQPTLNQVQPSLQVPVTHSQDSVQQSATTLPQSTTTTTKKIGTMYQTILQKSKKPLVVSALLFLCSHPMIHKLIMKLSSKFRSNDKLSILGLVLTSVIGGVFYYILSQFL